MSKASVVDEFVRLGIDQDVPAKDVVLLVLSSAVPVQLDYPVRVELLEGCQRIPAIFSRLRIDSDQLSKLVFAQSSHIASGGIVHHLWF